jgi:hypothetical protein
MKTILMAYSGYARRADTCPEGTAFYKCAVRPFTGCCSTNPCDTGVCADIDDCNSSSPAEGQASYPIMSEEQTTTLTVTVSEMIASLTTAVTISDVVTSIITQAAASTKLQAVTSSSVSENLASDLTASPSSLETSSTSGYLSTGSTLTETPVSSLRATAATASTATTAITHSSKITSSWMTQNSSAKSNPSTSKGPHASAVVGGIAGGLSLLGLLALLLLCCCCRRRAKYSFSMKRKSKEDEEEQERAELLRRAEEAALEPHGFLGTAISTGAQSPVNKGGTADVGPSPYPRNSTAVHFGHWI